MSEKKLQDYLHFYIGCKMMYSSHHEPQNEPYVLTFKNIEEAIEFGDRPILRRLDDITDEEKRECDKQIHKYDTGNCYSHYISDWAYRVDWLIKNQFDIFGLIDAGLAIDVKTLK